MNPEAVGTESTVIFEPQRSLDDVLSELKLRNREFLTHPRIACGSIMPRRLY